MVNGLERFKGYFEDHTDQYVIIGGTAVQVRIDQEGLIIRQTKDIDIVLVIEALDPQFVGAFWQFIEDGEYEVRHQTETEGRRYYRFRYPKATDFPSQLELFCRTPGIDLSPGSHLTPIPVDDDDITSLSAILMNDGYYAYTIEHSDTVDGLRIARIESLICLKARAFLDMMGRKEEVDEKEINKHKADIFRMGALLPADAQFDLPDELFADLKTFFDLVGEDLPQKVIYKNLGAPTLESAVIKQRIIDAFKLG
jgi:hypothetical protein